MFHFNPYSYFLHLYILFYSYLYIIQHVNYLHVCVMCSYFHEHSW